MKLILGIVLSVWSMIAFAMSPQPGSGGARRKAGAGTRSTRREASSS
jgi:hypothetical protein